MKICILTGKFGMGHYYAARAIKQQIEDSISEVEVDIIDWMIYVSPKLAEKYYRLFSLYVNKGYRLYNKRYLLLENRKTDQRPELSHYFIWQFSRFMKINKPDLIISTLPICSQIVSLYKEKTTSNVPLITCVTDITGHSEWISKHTELYMVASQSVKEKFLNKGVLSSKIYETGIPVRLEFNKVSVSEYGNSTLKKLLIMGGGLGIMPEADSFYYGLDQLPNTEVTIIAGKNQRLVNKISGKYSHVKVLGFVNNVYDYMQQADVVITKPGGVTTFEAIHAEVPILALNPLLQQEIYNTQYIQEMKIGTVISGDSKKCLEDITRILGDGTLQYFKQNMQILNQNFSKSNIVHILSHLICNTSNLKNISIDYEYENQWEDNWRHEKISFNI